MIIYSQWNIIFDVCVCVCVCIVHRQSREFLARGSRWGDQRFRRVPVRSGTKFHGHGAKLENGNIINLAGGRDTLEKKNKNKNKPKCL